MRAPQRMASLVAAATLTLIGGGPAGANGCPLVTDPAHDEAVAMVVPTDAPSLDIVSADLGVGDDVVAVVRVRDLAGGPEDGRWWIEFDSSSARYELEAIKRSGGTEFYVSRVEPTGSRTPIGTATGLFDVGADEVRIVAARSVFGTALADGTSVDGVQPFTHSDVVGVASIFTDTAATGSFVVGASSCV